MVESTASKIGQEKETLRKEVRFLNGKGNRHYVNVLTYSPVDEVTTLYPQIIQGMFLLYNYIEGILIDPSSQEGFLDRYLRTQYYAGHLIPDEEINRIKEDIRDGKYSQQLEAYLRQRREVVPIVETQSNTGYETYRNTREDKDAFHNKRATVGRILGLQANLQTFFGEIDYRKALLTEIILGVPFLESIVTNDELPKESVLQHRAYLDEAIDFLKTFDPKERFRFFEETTDKFTVSWTQEVSPPQLLDLDYPYIKKLYSFSDSMMEGKWVIEDLYDLYRQTILRRGKIFETVMEWVANKDMVKIMPAKIPGWDFENIAGYKKQKDFYKNLIGKVEERNRIVGDVRLVIAAGRQGLGKSIGVEAFLNNLPNNAKGVLIRVKEGYRYLTQEYEEVIRLAKLHPELELFAVMEDVDRFMGNRLNNQATGMFLDIDSISKDEIPPNFHLIATTNRPDVIDPAIMLRPGRATEVLVYNPPGVRTRRMIANLHAIKNGYQLSNLMVDYIGENTKSLTPDEIGYIFWKMRFENIQNPDEQDIDLYIKTVKQRRNVKKQASNFDYESLTDTENEDGDEDEDYELDFLTEVGFEDLST